MYTYVYIIYLYMYRGIFFPKRAFHGWTLYQKIFSWGKFWGEIYGKGLLYMDKIMIRSCQGRGNFINAFYNNLNTVNLFPDHFGIFT